MVDCVPDTRYIASPEFLLTISHCLAVIEVPVMSYGAYCILFKTPTSMVQVKWLMLNLHVWSVLSDVWVSVFSVPYVFLPIPAGYPSGILNAPRVAIYFSITFVGALTASVLAIYENRYFVLYGHKSDWKKYRKPVLFLIYLYVPLIFLPPVLNVPDQETSLPIVMSTIPCQNPHTYRNREIFVLSLDYKLPFACLAIGTCVLVTAITTFAAFILHRLFQYRYLPNYSLKTNILQKRFTIALTIQSVFMFSCVLAPVCMALVIVFLWYHNQALNNFIFIVHSLHGVGSTIVMVCVHRPYRIHTFGWMTREKFPGISKSLEKSANLQKNSAVVIAIL